ncbi:helix-turn-helix domain-containing protein [Streptomyces pactum]|uniref:Helix-turn-helix domain-containing protein n=1 Tax=Streptomyces pactum TaxID=68249 RepID=A0ABS0NRE5_9ACTN|nr:transcriptional regulator [Streptomyces pactum]MBH5337785.1 helix-turn-helix domain-containing protein [Streptomyces pactum]
MGSGEVERFAESLRELKERSGRSYGFLAKRLHMSTSTLHRYCSGEAVPAEFGRVERLALLCGANAEERIRLHRYWLLADAARRTAPGRTAAGRATDVAAGTDPGDGPGDGDGAGGGSGTEKATGGAAGAAGRGTGATAGTHPGDGAVGGNRREGTDPGTGPTAAPGTPGMPAGTAGTDGTAGAAGTADAAGRAGAAGDRRTVTPGQPQAVPVEPGGIGTGRHTPGHPSPEAGPEAVPGQPDAEAAPGAPRADRLPPSGAAAGPEARPGPYPADALGRPGPVAAAAFAARGAGRRTGLAWAVSVGAAAALVLAVTAAQVRPSSGGGRPETAAAPSSSRASEPAAGASGAPRARPSGDARGGEGDGAGDAEREVRHGARERATDRPEGTPAPSGSATGRPSGGPVGGARPGGDAGTGTPLGVSVRSHVWENGCDHRYLIDRPATRVAPPPVEQDAAAWAAAHGAVHGGTTNVEVTVRGRGPSAVVLRDLHVRVVGRRAPLPWSSFAMENGCGGALTPSAFSVNLDADRPLARPTDGFDGEHTLPAVRFPYRVSDTDPEVLLVNARTAGCDCEWYLELDWTSGDRGGTVRIDDGGRPFRTSGTVGRPEYGYALDDRAWRLGTG